ncbi:putative oxidoreductase CipA [Nemania sp. FL0916]|nr:putative oxidoreductase CipA [Nemania sp. FL0916]
MPEGNRVKKVAVVGATGRVGKHVITSLLASGKHQVTAITRSDSGSGSGIPDRVTIAKVSYDDPSSLTTALSGHDALVITMAVTAPPNTQAKLIEAAAAAKVPFVLPNEWGVEPDRGTLGKDVLMGTALMAARQKVEELGKSSWIAMVTGYWLAHSLASPNAYGFDIKNKVVTFYDRGTTKINNITWERTGEAVAGLLSLPIEPEAPGKPSLADYKNKSVFVSSWLLSQRDIFEGILRVSGAKESDWTIKYESAVDRYEGAKQRLFAGDRSAFQTLLYARTYYDNGDGDFESRHGLDNDKLGVPKDTQETLDEQIKLALKIAEEGYKY